jgi:hypothetical protein
LATASFPEPAINITDGYLSLFNGKDLTGWKTHPNQTGNWRVEGGVLIGTGSKITHLYSERGDYKNFHLHAEVRINDASVGAIFFRSPFGPQRPKEHPTFPEGYAVGIHGIKNGLVNKTGTLWAGSVVARSVREAPTPANGWFLLDVLAEGNHIIVKANGNLVSDFVDDKAEFTSGHIALGQFSPPEPVVEFRKIEIKELPSTVNNPPPAGSSKTVVPEPNAIVQPIVKSAWRHSINEYGKRINNGIVTL